MRSKKRGGLIAVAAGAVATRGAVAFALSTNPKVDGPLIRPSERNGGAIRRAARGADLPYVGYPFIATTKQ